MSDASCGALSAFGVDQTGGSTPRANSTAARTGIIHETGTHDFMFPLSCSPHEREFYRRAGIFDRIGRRRIGSSGLPERGLTMIYLDYNASTPVAPEVLEAMTPYLTRFFGNPSSSHEPGKRLREAIEAARARVAALIGAQPEEILFTSGATESNNQVILSIAHRHGKEKGHVITSAVEHPAILNPCRHLESLGFEVSYVEVDRHGRVDPQSVAGEVRPTTRLISIMHSNNEVGTLQPIGEIAEIAREGGIPMHTDAAQSCGKVPIDVRRLGVDFLSIAGHKMYAP